MPAQVYTKWSTTIPPRKPANDIERHELFTKYAREVADQQMPWLFPLLDACNALVIASPGTFCFNTHTTPGVWLDVPEMIQRLRMVPWATDDESDHSSSTTH